MKPNGGKSSGFTRVELLVAVFLAILAAVILLASLQDNRPRRMHCLSNIKQLGLATHMYLGDNEDWMPSKQPGHKAFFPAALCPYMGVALDMSKWCPSGNPDGPTDENYLAAVCRTNGVFRCNAWPKQSSPGRDLGLQYTINGIQWPSRSQPAAPAGAPQSPDVKLSDRPPGLNQIALFLELSAHREFTNYSEFPVMDANTSTFDQNGKRNSQANARMIWGGDKRHFGKSAVGFMDGHGEVRALTKEEMGYKKILNPLDEQARY